MGIGCVFREGYETKDWEKAIWNSCVAVCNMCERMTKSSVMGGLVAKGHI
jgi:hypothetical protein